MSASFDDPNLISLDGLVPVMQLDDAASLPILAQQRMTIPGDKGANPGAKITTLITGMVAGADSIIDMDLLRHGGMHRLFTRSYAPSTLGPLLRACTFGDIRHSMPWPPVSSPTWPHAPALVPVPSHGDDHAGGYVFVDVHDTIIEVHGHSKHII